MEHAEMLGDVLLASSERVCERLGLQIAYSTRPPADWVAHEERFRVPRVDTCFLPVTGEAEPAVLAGQIV